MAATKLEVLCTVYVQRVKNEQGEWVKRNRRTGEVVEIESAAEAERLLDMERGGRKLFRKVEAEEKEEAPAKSAPAPAKAPAPAANDK
jgi:hypothetical protein